MLIPGRLGSGHTADRDHSETNPPVWHRTHSNQPPLNPPRRRNLRATQTPQAGALTGHRSILAVGLGVRACQAGHRTAFATAAEWVARLAEAHHAGRLQAELVKLGRVPLLIIDEVGYIRLVHWSRARGVCSPTVLRAPAG